MDLPSQFPVYLVLVRQPCQHSVHWRNIEVSMIGLDRAEGSKFFQSPHSTLEVYSNILLPSTGSGQLDIPNSKLFLVP